MRHHDDYSAFELVIKEKLTRQKQDKNKTNKSISYLTPGGRTTATAVENYITLFLLLFKASPWGTEAIYALNRWITK